MKTNSFTMEQIINLVPEEELTEYVKRNKLITENDIYNTLLTVNESCKYLKISKMSLYRITKSGKLKKVKIGNRVCYERKDLDKFIRSSKLGNNRKLLKKGN